jgi:hypothetical protein
MSPPAHTCLLLRRKAWLMASSTLISPSGQGLSSTPKTVDYLLARARNGAAVTNARRQASESKYVRSWSRVWFWPIPPDTYVDPESCGSTSRRRPDAAR